MIFIRDDWAEEHHDVYLMDESGQRFSAGAAALTMSPRHPGCRADLHFRQRGLDFSIGAGFLTNFVSAGPNNGRLLSISIEGLRAVLTNASLAGAAATQMSRDPTDGVGTSSLCCRLKNRGGVAG
jgi:hypothetical protein